jgi:hypothetical protein
VTVHVARPVRRCRVGGRAPAQTGRSPIRVGALASFRIIPEPKETRGYEQLRRAASSEEDLAKLLDLRRLAKLEISHGPPDGYTCSGWPAQILMRRCLNRVGAERPRRRIQVSD